MLFHVNGEHFVEMNGNIGGCRGLFETGTTEEKHESFVSGFAMFLRLFPCTFPIMKPFPVPLRRQDRPARTLTQSRSSELYF